MGIMFLPHTNGKDERLGQDDPYLGILSPGAVEDVSVVRFEPGGIDFLRAVRLVVNVQQIVNAYQYREDVGIDLQRVLLPAAFRSATRLPLMPRL